MLNPLSNPERKSLRFLEPARAIMFIVFADCVRSFNHEGPRRGLPHTEGLRTAESNEALPLECDAGSRLRHLSPRSRDRERRLRIHRDEGRSCLHDFGPHVCGADISIYLKSFETDVGPEAPSGRPRSALRATSGSPEGHWSAPWI